jgi:hypothetical protein
MKSASLEDLNKNVIVLTAMVLDTTYSNITLQRVLKELAETLTPQQQEIIQRFNPYKKEMLERKLISLENTDPRLAAILSSILAGERPI